MSCKTVSRLFIQRLGAGTLSLVFKLKTNYALLSPHRSKTSSSEYVRSRYRDLTFEKFMDKYKNLLKVYAIQDLILANQKNQAVSIDFLNRLSQKLHLNRGATNFLRYYPHIFDIFYDTSNSQPSCRLTAAAKEIVSLESEAINASLPLVVDRLVRILSMSISKSVPLRAIFKVWRELGLPDNFEETIIAKNPNIFQLIDGHEPNTHVLKLVNTQLNPGLTANVEIGRVLECCNENCSVDRTGIQYSFKQVYPPGMKLKKQFRSDVKEWQKLPYCGPYDILKEKGRSKNAMRRLEKRAVGIVHEFMSLTVEKMVEVEKISHFRNSFGIELNIRDLFLDHPGIFYMSTKGKRHTVFLREAYERGCLIDPNPVYDARRKLLHLLLMEKRGFLPVESKSINIGCVHEDISDADTDIGEECFNVCLDNGKNKINSHRKDDC